MDEIFDQMLATPSWADGVSSMGIESLGVLPGLPKMDSTHRIASSSHMVGVMDNQMPSHSAMKINGSFDGSGLQQGAKTLSPMASSWREPLSESMPHMPTTMGSYSLSGDSMLNNLQLGKRSREEEEVMKAEMAQSDQLLFGQNGTGSGANGAMRPRVRARRGQATDPHSIAERKRRERIAERMKALQELVPDSNKTDKASMLDEIINYVKFLQMQVKCLSMCRLGGAGAAAPLLADMPGEGAASVIAANLAQASVAGGPSREGLAFAERQVAQLMDEDMSAAMQYLQSKGLCLMPISLATAISSTGVRQQKNSDTGSGDQVVMEMQAAVANGVANPGVMAALAMHGLNPSPNDSLTKSGSKSKETLEDGSGSESDKT